MFDLAVTSLAVFGGLQCDLEVGLAVMAVILFSPGGDAAERCIWCDVPPSGVMPRQVV